MIRSIISELYKNLRNSTTENYKCKVYKFIQRGCIFNELQLPKEFQKAKEQFFFWKNYHLIVLLKVSKNLR